VFEVINSSNSLIVILDFNIQNVNSLAESGHVVVASHLGLAEPKKSVVLIMSDLFLLIDESFLKLNFFSNREIIRIMLVAVSSVLAELTGSQINF
jgi:hypothetical protein